jgi:hypothetical protein
MLESNKIPYYAFSFLFLIAGFIMLIVYGFIYVIMAISNSMSEIEPVKNKCIIASIIVSIGVILFMVTLGLDYKKVFG